MNKILKCGVALIGASAAVIALIGCSSINNSKNNVTSDSWNKKVEAPAELPIATIKIKDYGVITAKLYPDKAPNTVNNFISLANSRFYDGLTFHRVIKGFMIQGGCPNGNGTGGPGYSIKGEFSENGYKFNDLKHTEGILSMARTNNPDSAGSQFFIMLDDAPHLDGHYAAFGRVTSGMDVAHDIEVAGTSNGPVVIESMTVNTYGIEYSAPDVIQ